MKRDGGHFKAKPPEIRIASLMRQKRTNLLSQTPTTRADLGWGRKLLLPEIVYEELWREASV